MAHDPFTRREFLRLAAAASVGAAVPFVDAAGTTRTLRAGVARVDLVGAPHPATAVWSYEGTVPGPVLRFKQGDRLRIEVENRLPDPTTVHWHGIRVPNAMDGVPNLTQRPIPSDGGRFIYEFELADAGTFWYHPHWGSPEQVGRGLYGALIVEERRPPPADRDVVWVLSDWRLDRNARNVDDFGNFMDASHAGRIGNTVTVNGAVREAFDVRAGERIRLRLINTANARIFRLRFEGHDPWLVALDGHPIETYKTGPIVLGPGMRADLLLDCTATATSRHRVIDDFYPRQAYRLLDLAYSDERSMRQVFADVPMLAPNPVARLQLDRAERHELRFEGGMMGRMPSLRGQGETRRSMPMPAGQGGMMGGMPMTSGQGGMLWSINGKAADAHAHDGEPLLTLTRGGRTSSSWSTTPRGIIQSTCMVTPSSSSHATAAPSRGVHGQTPFCWNRGQVRRSRSWPTTPATG